MSMAYLTGITLCNWFQSIITKYVIQIEKLQGAFDQIVKLKRLRGEIYFDPIVMVSLICDVKSGECSVVCEVNASFSGRVMQYCAPSFLASSCFHHFPNQTYALDNMAPFSSSAVIQVSGSCEIPNEIKRTFKRITSFQINLGSWDFRRLAFIRFRREPQHCFTVNIQKCFVNQKASPSFPLVWRWVDIDFWVNYSF